MDIEQAPKQRKRRRRPSTPDYLNFEGILRKSLCDSFKEFLRHCSLAGARQICEPGVGWMLRVIWGLVFCVALATIAYFLRYTWLDTLSKPLIVTMESSTYPIDSIDFPAIAICNINRISKKALRKLAIEEMKDLTVKGDGNTIEDVEATILNWGRLITFTYNESLRMNPMFTRLVDKYRSDSQRGRIESIMRMLAPTCDDMLLRCTWEAKLVECSSIFTMHRIANRGHCCTFNYWSRRMGTPIKRQFKAGELNGLNVFMDPHLDDYSYPLNMMEGFDVLILDPTHFADPSSGRVVHKISQPNVATQLKLKSVKQIATTEVRKYSIETRKCRFQNEISGNIMFPYSYSGCIVYCRIHTLYSLCRCTPYFWALKGMQKGPVCTFEDLKCLHKYREKLYYLYPYGVQDTQGLEFELSESLFCPDCLPDCELTQYSTKSFETPLEGTFGQKEFLVPFIDNIRATNRSFLSIFQPVASAKLDRLDVVFYWFEIISNIGGFCGLVIGFSFITVIELIYFMLVRFVFHFYTNYQKYYW